MKNNIKLVPLFLFAITTLVSCTSSHSGNPADFIAYYSFDSTLVDKSGHFNHANKYGNTIRFEEGVKNSCIRFFNKNNKTYGDVNDFLRLPNINVINFSIAFWVKYEKNNHDFQPSVYSFGDDKIGDGPRDFLVFWVLPNGTLSVSMQAGTNVSNTPQIDISNSKWIHIAYTVGDNKICLYQNGELYYTKNIDFEHNFYNLPQYVAYHQWNNGQFYSSRFSGSVDELYIYNRELSKNEIVNLAK